MLFWGAVAVAAAAAIAAWMRSARTARKLEALTQSYWELRYDFTRLRSQVARLDPETEPAETPAAAPPAGGGSYIPLASMKKKG
jgi:hypothetical protein